MRLTLAFTALGLAISILALLLVTYLPTIYQAYTSRESFETMAGDPPNVTAMVIRAHELMSLDRLSVVWVGRRDWFAELRESHTSLPAVAFLGSSRTDRNWVATVGTLLDCASMSLAVSADPISITKAGFDAAYDELVAAGVPVHERRAAWVAWSGWRVNYDAALVGLAKATASSTTRLTEGGTYGARS